MLEVTVRHAFPGFSLDVAIAAATPGVTALFGPSGCGKTTVLAAVCGLLAPAAGRVVLDGTVLLDTVARVAVPAERRRCGVVFQEARLFPHMSVERNLAYGMRRAPGSEAAGPSLMEVAALLGLKGLLTRRPGRLSGGERQRVALGRALLSRPRLLVMDEPLAALDAGRRAEVLPYLARVRDVAGVPILYVTHALDEVDRLADTLVLMEAGRVVAAGSVEALSARPDLPLAARRDAGAVLACRVIGSDAARGLTQVAFAGGALVVPLLPESLGTALRLRVRARDVSIAVVEPVGLSVQNVLPAVLEGIVLTGGGHEAMLTLRVGDSVLLARVTRDAVGRLGLVQGMGVWALVKSIAFDHRA